MRAVLVLATTVLLCLAASVSHAQDFAGTWQGHAKIMFDERVVFRIGKADAPGWSVQVLYGEDWAMPEQVHSVVIADGKIKISMDGGNYEGLLSPDGQALRGALTVDGLVAAITLNLTRATPATLWTEPPHKVQRVTV